MKINSSNHQRFHLLPIVIFAGLIVGIVFSWSRLTKQDSSQPSPIPTEISVYETFPTSIQTATIDQSITSSLDEQSYSVPSIGKAVPNFSLITLDGNQVSLSDFKGKAVFINLWASWCPPCRLEMPDIQAAYEKYQTQDLVVLGINITNQDNLADARAFVEEFKLTFPILLDESGEVSAGLFRLLALPTSFFIDSEGILQRIQIGAIPTKNLDTYISEILPE
jgi:peroxiredoxin